MEQKRFVVFMVLATAILFGWQFFVMPRFFPAPPRPVAKQAPPAAAKDKAQQAALKPQKGAEPKAEKEEPEPKPALASVKLDHPHREIVLGSLKPESGYRLRVIIDSRGAAIKSIVLNDPRYPELTPPYGPLQLVGVGNGPLETLQMAIPALDQQLKPHDKTAGSIDWEVVPGSESDAGVTLRLLSPDGKLEVLKRFGLRKIAGPGPGQDAPAYAVLFEVTFKSHGKGPQVVSYDLQGPVGLPLENPDNTHKFRDVAAGFLTDRGAVDSQLMTAKEIADGKVEEWKQPLKYIGVDVQYFAALLVPREEQSKQPYFESARAMLAGANLKERSPMSVLLTSNPVTLPIPGEKPASQFTHSYDLFAGPKRENLLAPLGATGIIDYGISGNLYIPQAMLALLDFFHSLFPAWAWPYGWAIIMLTVVVRMCLFPLSRKQALSAAKMQEIQPEIAALKKKYGNDTEKLGRAQMELFRKHNYNPLGGCLPMLVQLPVMIGLYQALSISVDLRWAKFLWIDNLAAPDALFRFPFRLPFLGENFNLLPIITIGLFIVQQKMFMPPPVDKEQEMQQKMMSYMMIFMGFMFYSVPAGLCVYFIASSVWGLAERKLLPKMKPAAALGGGGSADGGGNGGDGSAPPAPRPSGQKFDTRKKARNRR